MLGSKSAMVNIAVNNISVAREFYENTLGLIKLREDPSGRTMYKTGDTALFIYVSEFAGSNKADYVAWEVGDEFQAIVADLRDKNVTFDTFPDMPGVRIEKEVHIFGNTGIVWLRDPDDNFLLIVGEIS